MSQQQHIIFDLDGTIIDSKPEIISTYLKVFTQCPPPREIDTNKLNFGTTLQDVLKQVYEDESDQKKAKLLFSPRHTINPTIFRPIFIRKLSQHWIT